MCISNLDKHYKKIKIWCERCQGRGEYDPGDCESTSVRCFDCKGKGYTEKKQEIE